MIKLGSRWDRHPWSSLLFWSRITQTMLYLIFSLLVIFYIYFITHMLKITNSVNLIRFPSFGPGSDTITTLESLGLELISDFGQVGLILIPLILFMIFYILTSIILITGHQTIQEKVLSDLGIGKILNENKFLKLKWSFLNHSFLILNTKKSSKIRTEASNLFWRINYELLQ